MSARIESPAKSDSKRQTAVQKRQGFAETIGAICEQITGLEYKVGAILWDALATYPDSTDGRKAFYIWASKTCGGRKEGMIRRWMTAANVLHRVPSFKTVSTKLDTLQFVAGLPDEDIVAIAGTFEGKPAPTEAAVKKAALKVSETAQKREARRVGREADALASTRVKNLADIEQHVSKMFGPFADDVTTLTTLVEEGDVLEALIRAYANGAKIGAKTGNHTRVIATLAKKYMDGEHLKTDEDS